MRSPARSPVVKPVFRATRPSTVSLPTDARRARDRINPMRQGVVVLAVVALMGIAACGNDDAVAPLPLDQRVAGEAEAPGSEPDPVETRRTAAGLEELATTMEDQLITATDEEKAAFGEAGFVSAILDTRFFPNEPGAAHQRTDSHIATLVMQFTSEVGATDATDLLHTDGLEPCPETCAFAVAEFEVDGIPNGRGIQRIATQESLDRVGDTDRPPHAEYSIFFADGPFAYVVRSFGPPDGVSEQQTQEVAANLYARVQGAPPAPEG